MARRAGKREVDNRFVLILPMRAFGRNVKIPFISANHFEDNWIRNASINEIEQFLYWRVLLEFYGKKLNLLNFDCSEVCRARGDLVRPSDALNVLSEKSLLFRRS